MIKHVVKKLTLPAGGFYTKEMGEHSDRAGFKIVTLNNEEAVIAFPLTNAIKKRGDVSLSEVHRANREELVSDLCEQFRA